MELPSCVGALYGRLLYQGAQRTLAPNGARQRRQAPMYIFRSTAARESHEDQSSHDKSAQQTCQRPCFRFAGRRRGRAQAEPEPKLSPALTSGSLEKRDKEPEKALDKQQRGRALRGHKSLQEGTGSTVNS